MVLAPDCTRCQAFCCRRLDIHLSAADVARLAAALDVPGESFVELALVEGSSADSFLLSATGPEYELVLARRAGGAGETDDCVFLLQLQDGSRRCGVHALRPLVCRCYPFFLEDMLLRVDADHLCPDDAFDSAQVEAAPQRIEIMRKVVERDVHRLLLDAWNRQVAVDEEQSPARTAGDLLAHLFAGDARCGPEVGPILEDEALLDAWCQATLAAHSPLLPRGAELPPETEASGLDARLTAIRSAARG